MDVVNFLEDRLSAHSNLFDEVDLLPRTPPQIIGPWLDSFASSSMGGEPTLEQSADRRLISSMHTPYKQAMQMASEYLKVDSAAELVAHCDFIRNSFSQPLRESMHALRTASFDDMSNQDTPDSSRIIQCKLFPDEHAGCELHSSAVDVANRATYGLADEQIVPRICGKRSRNQNRSMLSTHATSHNAQNLVTKKSHLAPLQLPVKIFKKFKGEMIEGIFLYADSIDAHTSAVHNAHTVQAKGDDNAKESRRNKRRANKTPRNVRGNDADGDANIACEQSDLQDGENGEDAADEDDGNNRRASTFVLITKSTRRYRQYEGHVCTSLTGALFFCQNNSENGWSYVEANTGVKLHNFRVKNGGSGFINPPGAHALYRDYLSWSRLEQAKNNRKFYQPENLVSRMATTSRLDKIVHYLCRTRPDLLRNLPDTETELPEEVIASYDASV